MEVKNITAGLAKFFEGEKVKKIILLTGVLGIALIALSTLLQPLKENKAQPVKETEVQTSFEEYETELEERLSKIVVAITGDTQPSVMITLESSPEYIYASDEKKSERQDMQGASDKDIEGELVIIRDSEGNERPVTVFTRQPDVRGVVVVTKAKLSKTMEEKLISAVRAVTGVSSAKVCVINA